MLENTGGFLPERGPSRFATTCWSVVRQASVQDRDCRSWALGLLFRGYWKPLKAFLLAQGLDQYQADDVLQGFFLYLMEKETLEMALPDRGRFRSFLLTCLKNFLRDHFKYRKRAKRGGGLHRLSLDDTACGRVLALPEGKPPDRLFERRWAAHIVDAALEALEKRHGKRGKQSRFDCLRPYLVDEADHSDYSRLSREMGISAGAVKVAVCRLRGEFGELLKKEVASTLTHGNVLEDEMRYLLGRVGSGTSGEGSYDSGTNTVQPVRR